MLKFIAARYAKIQYRFRQLTEAATNELHAKLADQLVKEHRDKAAQLTKEAEQMDARIKEMDEKLDKGFWECENGHESPSQFEEGAKVDTLTQTCECGSPAKLIKRSEMSGQEKYESDKERKEAEDIATQKRAEAEQEEKSAQESEKAAQYFRGIAQNNRSVAEKLRRT